MSYLIKPKGYKALLNLPQTEMGIKMIKEFFQANLSSELRLRRVTAPLFVLKGMGLEDVIVNLIPLVIIASITLTLAGRTFKRKLG